MLTHGRVWMTSLRAPELAKGVGSPLLPGLGGGGGGAVACPTGLLWAGLLSLVSRFRVALKSYAALTSPTTKTVDCPTATFSWFCAGGLPTTWGHD